MIKFQFKIWHKLALIFTLTAIISISIGIGLSYRQFKQGFLEYRQSIEQRKLSQIADQLILTYQQNNNWDFIRGNHRRWFYILRPAAQKNLHRRHSSPPERPFREALIKRALLDEHQQYLVGNKIRHKESFLFPVKLDGKIIAYIQSHQPVKLMDRLDTVFANRLYKAFLINFIIASVIAIIISLLVSYYIKRRLNPISKIARELTLGHYHHRISHNSTDELGQLASNINQLAITLEKNKQAQKQWIAGISHELRTPVAILKGEIEAVKDGIRPLNQALIESLAQETERISLLIEDLYQLSTADLGALKYKKESFMMSALLDELADVYEFKAKKHQLQFTLTVTHDDDFLLVGDRQRLYQLFSNLLENSCRYTDAGGQIQIKSTLNDKELMIEIEDTKPGIADEHLQHIFQPLYRVEKSRTRNHGGAGLGLAIAQQIIDAHHGQIKAGKSVLGGLSIQCVFPLQ